METSRCEAATEVAIPGEIELPADASPEEAAAILAALTADLEAERAGSTGDGEPHPGIDPWTLAGRLWEVVGGTRRPRPEAPLDPWTAADRADRF